SGLGSVDLPEDAVADQGLPCTVLGGLVRPVSDGDVQAAQERRVAVASGDEYVEKQVTMRFVIASYAQPVVHGQVVFVLLPGGVEEATGPAGDQAVRYIRLGEGRVPAWPGFGEQVWLGEFSEELRIDCRPVGAHWALSQPVKHAAMQTAVAEREVEQELV